MNLHSNLPNLFIVGAAKAGTTTLYDTLIQHPDIYFPFEKEPAFFCEDEYYERGVEWYLRTFYKTADSKPIRGDATPRYLFWGEKVVPRLRSLYGNRFPFVIVIFRDPVALVNSYYWHSVREGREALNFRDALDNENHRLEEFGEFLHQHGRLTYQYSRIARYAEHLTPYMDYIPKESFLFLLTEDLKAPDGLIQKIEGFLNLNHYENINVVRSNAASMPRSQRLNQWLRNPSGLKNLVKHIVPRVARHKIKSFMIESNLKPFTPPPLDPEIGARLKEMYRSEVEKLQEIIGRDLSSWL